MSRVSPAMYDPVVSTATCDLIQDASKCRETESRHMHAFVNCNPN